ncbi:MAG: winged helix-turn-helix domain-containing protein, partial [Myxococcota bacterium]
MNRLVLRAGELQLDRAAVARRDGPPVALTPAELRVLGLLVGADGGVVSRAALQDAWGGQSGSERWVDTVVRRLRTKLELDPGRPDHLLTAHAEGYRLVVERPRPLPLPAQPGPLFGRVDEVGRVVSATFAALTGPAGIGKSRVLLAAAHRRGGRVLWVDAERCDTAEVLLLAVARALGIEVGGARQLDATVSEGLAARSVDAVYVDHGEALGGSAFDLLRAVPGVSVVVASRAVVDGADPIEVAPLPPAHASALFLHHAAAVDAPWVGDPAATELVPGVVDRLERVPLAIVLAAGRSAAFGPRALLERLDDRLRLLTARGGDPRHRTLRAALDLSWDR